MPTEYGPVRVVVFREEEDTADGAKAEPGEEHVALVVGDVSAEGGAEAPLVRVHSECWTGEVLRSRKCDCRDQLDYAMRAIEEAGRGVVVYLRQEGRGIGLGNKIRAYALQEQGHDTVDANRMLGFADDARTYDVAAADGLRAHGVDVVRRVPIAIAPNEHNADYLAVKAKKMGHEL